MCCAIYPLPGAARSQIRALVVPEGERIAVGDRLAPHEAEKQTFRYRRDVSYQT